MASKDQMSAAKTEAIESKIKEMDTRMVSVESKIQEILTLVKGIHSNSQK
jgi:hypothetical protein